MKSRISNKVGRGTNKQVFREDKKNAIAKENVDVGSIQIENIFK